MEFSTSFAVIPQIAEKIFKELEIDEVRLDRILAREEISYYATGLLWLRLIDVKIKQATIPITFEERNLHEDTIDTYFNIPQPLAEYLSHIGDFNQQILNIPVLPTSVVQGMGGYHANEITENNHNLFEEIPCLGVAGDMIMSLCQEADEPMPNFHVAIPQGARFTNNLVGKFSSIGPRSVEIKRRLAGQEITATSFKEYMPNTRFHLLYMLSLSDIIGEFKTFRNEKLCFSNLTAVGGEAQVIETKPLAGEDKHLQWISRSVQTSTASSLSVTAGRSKEVLAASFVFGFQLYKERGEGETDTEQHANWCCLEGTGPNGWTIPEACIKNRNARHNLPPEIGNTFKNVSNRQDLNRVKFIRGMVKTRR